MKRTFIVILLFVGFSAIAEDYIFKQGDIKVYTNNLYDFAYTIPDGKTYYFNYINATNEPDLDESECPTITGGRCGKFIVNNSGD